MSSDCYIMHQYASHNKSSCIWIIGPSEYSIIENKTDDLILKYYFSSRIINNNDITFNVIVTTMLKAIMGYTIKNEIDLNSAKRIIKLWKKGTSDV